MTLARRTTALGLGFVVWPALFACGGQSDPFSTTEDDATGVRWGVDYAWTRPSPSGLKAQGFTFACRYLSYDTTGKNLSHAEADALIAAGLDVVSNWEWGAMDALSGYGLGVTHAQAAEMQALADGAPSTRPIYFSVDFDATPGDQGAIDAYFDGVASVIGRNRTGAYGGYWVIKRLFDAGKITWGWQTYAWSGGLWDARAQLRQVQNDIGNGEDRDEAVAPDFGQWGHGLPSAPYAARFVAQSFPLASQPPIAIHAGDSVDVWIELKNVGTHAWDSNTKLGTTGPRDRTSALAAPTWPAPDRPARVTGTVQPGETYRFNFTVLAPEKTGRYDEHFGVVQEGVAWFSDQGQGGPPDDQLEGIWQVDPARPEPPSADAGMEDGGVRDGGDIIALDATGSNPVSVPPETDAGSPSTGASPSASHVIRPNGCTCAGAPRPMSFGALLIVAFALVLLRSRRRNGARASFNGFAP